MRDHVATPGTRADASTRTAIPARAADGVVAEQGQPGRLGSKSAESQWPDEPSRARGQYRADHGSGVAQTAADLDGLVGGDPPTNTQNHAPPTKRARDHD